MYAPDLITYEDEIDLKDPCSLEVPHWCFPESGEQFC